MLFYGDNMLKVVLETYDREYSFLRSMEYSNKRHMSPELESSFLISDFHKLFFDSFEYKLKHDNQIRDVFWEINQYCVDHIKTEYERTKDLDILEFRVWHLSVFMTIQSFITITDSKYTLNQKNEIEELFVGLLNDELYDFIKLNSEEEGIVDISKKLFKVLGGKKLKYVLTQPPNSEVIRLDCDKDSFQTDFDDQEIKFEHKHLTLESDPELILRLFKDLKKLG